MCVLKGNARMVLYRIRIQYSTRDNGTSVLNGVGFSPFPHTGLGNRTGAEVLLSGPIASSAQASQPERAILSQEEIHQQTPREDCVLARFCSGSRADGLVSDFQD